MKIEDALRRYAELKTQAKAIEAELEEINPIIKEHMLSQGIDKMPTNIGTFTVSETSRWKFSKAVETLQEEEKRKGIAQKVVITMLKFTAPKNEKAIEEA